MKTWKNSPQKLLIIHKKNFSVLAWLPKRPTLGDRGGDQVLNSVSQGIVGWKTGISGNGFLGFPMASLIVYTVPSGLLLLVHDQCIKPFKTGYFKNDQSVAYPYKVQDFVYLFVYFLFYFMFVCWLDCLFVCCTLFRCRNRMSLHYGNFVI